MSAKDEAHDLHVDALNWDPRRQGTPEHEAARAAVARLKELDAMYARSSRRLVSWAPDELAGKAESTAHVMRAGGWSGRPEDWASLAAVCLAGWCSAMGAAEMDPTSGEAA